MAYEYAGDGGLDYFPCRYGKSKLLFRGPRRVLDGDHCAVLGGSETYGKFVAEPFAALTERALGMPVVNFGYMNAGIDVFVNEPTVIEACSQARVTVVQIMGAQNTSNRFYAVHPRRNDRFLRASALMKGIFREVDFTEYHFTRHMLSSLHRITPDKFAILADELRSAWLSRMRLLLQRIAGDKLLLWLGDYHPDGHRPDELGPEPYLVDEDLVQQLQPLVRGVVRVAPSPAARAAATEGMRFSPLDAPAAGELPGVAVHAEIAAALAPALRALL